MSDTLLKLAALDEDDLAILSAHVQDAVLTLGDMCFLPKEQRFAMVVNRFDWEANTAGQGNRRRRSGLHFERVRSVKSKGVDLSDKTAVLNLLAIAFEPGETPAGAVFLHFSGGASIRLEVECVEAGMKDLGPMWAAKGCPGHNIVEA